MKTESLSNVTIQICLHMVKVTMAQNMVNSVRNNIYFMVREWSMFKVQDRHKISLKFWNF